MKNSRVNRFLRAVRRRVIPSVALVAVLWHMAASFLWITPPTPLRDLIPGKMLEGYMLPWFGQSWSVFAPEPIDADHHILVRYRTAGMSSPSPWIDATAAERQLALHNPFPPKAADMGMSQARGFEGVWKKLSSSSREAVRQDFIAADSLRAHRDDLGLGEEYVQQDERTTRYATLVALTAAGQNVESVQFLVQRQGIIPFDDRLNPLASRPAPTEYVTGWRDASDISPAEAERFASTFSSLMAR